MVNFVVEAGKYVCDYNLPEYVRKNLAEKAWIEVGIKSQFDIILV